MKSKAPLLISLLLSQQLSGQYVVDQVLGTLSSTTPLTIVADTAASLPDSPARNIADFHAGVTNPALNWGHERVIQFELTEPAILTLSSFNATDVVGDPDFILLDDLSVAFDPDLAKNEAQGSLGGVFLDFPPETESLGAYLPGIYYIVVESYDGNDAAVTEPGFVPSDSSCNVLLEAVPAAASDFSQYIGVLASAGSSLSIDTLSSTIDTTIALFDSDGVLLQENDDSSGFLQSALDLSTGLQEGTYFVAVGGKDADFSAGLFDMTAGPTVAGDFTLTYSIGESFLPEDEVGTIDLTYAATSIQVYEFDIGPTSPTSFTSLGEFALADEPFVLDLGASSFDTQLMVYDSQGFRYEFNDDLDFANGIYTSYLDLDTGLYAGTWYAVVTGWPNDFFDGFGAFPDAGGTESGTFSMVHPLGTASGAFASGGQAWFQFTIVENVLVQPEIEVTNVSLVGNQLTLEWDGTGLSGTYEILGSTTGENFTVIPGQGLINGTTTTITIDTTTEPVKLLRVRELILAR